MIVLEELSFSYSSHGRPLFERLNLTVDRCSWITLTGPEAAGKTTLGKLIKGLLKPDSGRVIFDNSMVSGYDEVGYIGGDPYDFAVGVTVQEDVAFGLETMGLPLDEMQQRVQDTLCRTGLSGMENRLVHTLSGGEQQRLAFATVLAMGIRILILDESFAMLDKTQRTSIRAEVASLRSQFGITVIETPCHVADMLTTDRVVFLDRGSVAFDGTPEAFLATERGAEWALASAGVLGLAAAMHERGLLGDLCLSASGMMAELRH